MLAKDGTFVERKLAAILAADVAGYSRLMEISYKRGWALRVLGKHEDSLAAFKQADVSSDAPLNMAINLLRLGRTDEAKVQVKLMLEKNDPKFTQAKWREGYFYSDPSIVEAEVADLAKAGLPEK